MSDLLQVILINLIVSLDNIGIIALASRHLEPSKANTARIVGVWLSLGLKLVFILLIGQLFTITWLHIRIIGGAMLVYVIIGMFRGHEGAAKKPRGNTFLKAMFIIILADISMSLDNVIAVLAIVADEAGNITTRGLMMAFIGLIVSVPVLLIGSEAIIKLINRHKVLFALATGYLGYIAANMIFEDHLMESLFDFLHFPFAPQLAVIIGFAVGVACWLTFRTKPVA
jgi:YjbE family integral membrane protein